MPREHEEGAEQVCREALRGGRKALTSRAFVGAVQAVHDPPRWMLRLDPGEDLFATLAAFAGREHVRAGVVLSGIGMLAKATVGFWNGQEYATTELAEPHELVALHGSIAEADGAPSLHLHAGLADRDHRLRGGHLVRATVGVLAEIAIEEFPGRVFGRPLDESFGLRRLDLDPGPHP